MIDKWYKLPILERFTHTAKNMIRSLCNVKYVDVDGVGILVYYDKEKQLELTNLRRHLSPVRTNHCYVDAQNPTEAIEKFLSEWEGTKVGSKSSALRIDLEKPILELPYCENLNVCPRGNFICGELSEDGINGSFGGCILAMFDRPDGSCPIGDFYDAIYDFDSGDQYHFNTLWKYKVKITDTEYEIICSCHQPMTPGCADTGE